MSGCAEGGGEAYNMRTLRAPLFIMFTAYVYIIAEHESKNGVSHFVCCVLCGSARSSCIGYDRPRRRRKLDACARAWAHIANRDLFMIV